MKSAYLLTITAILLLIMPVYAQEHDGVVQVAQIYNLLDEALDVVVVDDIAYIAGGRSGLHIVDVSDQENPETIGCWSYNPGEVRTVFVSGDYAYSYINFYDGEGQLSIIDISDSENPHEV